MAVRPLRPVVTRQGVTTQISWAAIVSALLMLSSFGGALSLLIQGFNAEMAVYVGASALWGIGFAILALVDKDFR